MEKLVAGDIVAIRFPFSNLRSTKLRPALVLGTSEHGDYIVCQITSKAYASKIAIKISPADTKDMLIESYVRPDKIFTADPSLIVKGIVPLAKEKQKLVKSALKRILAL